MPYENVLHTTAYPLLSRIPAPVLEMLFFLEEKGFEAWIVGGFHGTVAGLQHHLFRKTIFPEPALDHFPLRFPGISSGQSKGPHHGK